MFVAKLLFVCATVALVAANPQALGGGTVGAPEQLSADEFGRAIEILQSSLNKLAAGEGPNYTLVALKSASTQVVAGSLDKFVAELSSASGENKICEIDIWTQSWIKKDGVQVTFKCPDEPTLIKKHDP